MEYRTRKIIMPGDLNPRHILFGGKLLAWIDEECYIYASCQLDTQSLVTKLIGEIEFKAPAQAGDIIEIGVDTVDIGNTSLTLKCEVRNKTTKKIICLLNRIVFVHVDENGKSVPHSKSTLNHHQAVS
jgi:acyl-CoA thioesterase YciA